jgi:hypothetical protein
MRSRLAVPFDVSGPPLFFRALLKLADGSLLLDPDCPLSDPGAYTGNLVAQPLIGVYSARLAGRAPAAIRTVALAELAAEESGYREFYPCWLEDRNHWQAARLKTDLSSPDANPLASSWSFGGDRPQIENP